MPKKVEPTTIKSGEGFTRTGMPENDIFYFHPDHLTPVNICILESLNLVPRFGKYFVYYNQKRPSWTKGNKPLKKEKWAEVLQNQWGITPKIKYQKNENNSTYI